MPILERKLAVVQQRYGRSDFEKRHYALHGLMCIYGIELLPDNAEECRDNLEGTFARLLRLTQADPLRAAARAVLDVNIVQGDALAMTDAAGEHIVFAEWGYLGRGRYQRRDFRFDALAARSSGDREVFIPIRTYPLMTVDQIALGSAG